MIEFTADEIRLIWTVLFDADVPQGMTTRQVYEACLAELSPEILRDELQRRRKV